MPRRAAIYVQYDRPYPDRQEAVALRYAGDAGLNVVALCHHGEDGASMVRAGVVDVIVSALDVDPRIEALIEDAGGAVAVVRPATARGVASQMIVTMYRNSGGNVRLIAKLLGQTTGEIRSALVRGGIRASRPGGGRSLCLLPALIAVWLPDLPALGVT